MAIRYDHGYNAKISRIVRNFNQKRNRAYARGFRDLPEMVKVTDLKARYTNRRELNKQLRILSKFSAGRNDILDTIETDGGATSTAWNLQYLKSNEKQARDYFLREYKSVASKVGRFPGERMRLDALRSKIDFLDMDIKYMDQEQFRSYQSAINEYLRHPSVQSRGYRGFLTEVEYVMRVVGLDNKEIKNIMNKINTLTPNQFHRLYEENDLIGKIYDLAYSPTHGGGLKLTSSVDNAREVIDEFKNNIDGIIEEAKKDPISQWDVEDFLKPLTDKDENKYEEMNGKKPLSKMSKKEIYYLKELDKIDPGWWEANVDETK